MRHANTRHARLLQFARGLLCAPLRLIQGFGRDRRGGTLVFVALAIVPLVGFVGLAIDTTRGYLVKARLNQAIDAAALAGGRVYTSPTRDADIQMFFKANFPDGYMNAVTTPLAITANAINRTLTVTAQATMPTTFMHLVNIDSIDVASTAEITVAAQNVEVTLVLDITGSMAGSKIVGLRDAANTLVDIVVQDQQTPFYTKAAIVPYSQAVNVGTLAPQVRGNMPTIPIHNITKANPAVVTAYNHGFITGDKIFITGVQGLTRANNVATASVTAANNPQFWVVTKISTDTFSLKQCSNSSCSSTSAISSTGWSGTYAADTGAISCTTVGCPYLSFKRDSDNAWLTWLLNSTNCVTERVGADAYTDVAPSTSVVGPKYEPAGGIPANTNLKCISHEILPLTSDKTALHNRINGLTEYGLTAAQIGIAWGWYLLSPNFSYLLPSESQPAPYGSSNLLKVAVIMTDGDFNTVYNQGVVSQDSGGSGNTQYKINQNSTNGDAYTQAQALCDAMKAPAPGPSIEIFTVGLALSNQAAIDIMNYCATNASHVYLPASGADMEDVFKDIAMKISRLRLSK